MAALSPRAALYLLFFLISVRGGIARSQSARIQDFHHTAWNSENGLGAVFNIQQSNDGFLWLTTSRGVLRFDGVRFESVEQVTFGAAQDGDILSVFVAPSGSVWLTTRSAGVLLWKDGRLIAFPDRRCTPAGQIGGMVAEDGDESLWFESTSGLTHLHGSTCELVGKDRGYPGGLPKAMFIDHAHTVWVVSQSGTMLFKRQGEFVFQPFNGIMRPLETAVSIREDTVGRMWIADDSGLRRLVQGDREVDSSRTSAAKGSSPTRDFVFAPDGSLWAVTGEGVSLFASEAVTKASPYLDAKPVENFTPQQGLSSDAVWKVLIDREGTVWIGTNTGLDCLRRSLLNELILPHMQEHENGLVAGAKGSIWVGNSGTSLTHVALDGRVKSFPEITQVTCIRRDRNGTIWVGGGANSFTWRSNGDGFVQMPGPVGDRQPVVALEVDRSNAPWIYTLNGLTYRMMDGSWINENQELGKKTAVLGAMTSDESGNIWFAFSDKVVKWDGRSFERFSYPEGLHNVSPATMSARNNHVWLAGRGGVDLFSAGHFYQMRWKDKNLVGRVSGIAETASGELWINGFSGITHVSGTALANWLHHPASEVMAEHFDTLDGLPGFSGERLPEPSLVEAPDGKLWFATTKGLAWLDPEMLIYQRNRLRPTVVITSLNANGQVLPGWKDLILPQHTKNLEIDYTALSLAIPQRVLFRYKLEGYDRDWQDAGTRRQVFYTGVPPGRYRMRVMACNNDGLWSETGASLNLMLQPAFYQALWFLCLCGILMLIAGWGGYQFRVGQLAAAMRVRFNERLDERARLARDLHDTLLQTIQASKLTADQALERATDMAGMRIALERLSDWLGQGVEEGRAALNALHISSTETNDLAAAIRMAVEECLMRGAMQVEFSVEGNSRDMHPIVRDEVYRIAYEAIRNACAHSEATLLKVRLLYTQDLTLRVIDNGKGIDPGVVEQGKEGHFGLSGIRERATRIGATLDLRTRQPGGTDIALIVPGKAIFLKNGSRRGS